MKARHIFKTILVFGFVAALVSLWGVSQTTATTGSLDGRTFTCATGNKGMKAHDKDELRFGDGKLHSALFEKWGFGETVYTYTVEGDEIRFQAEASSPDHGRIVWQGEVKGDRIDLTYNWISQDWHWKDHHGEAWCRGEVKR